MGRDLGGGAGPLISVLLPVRDGAVFLREALESVLAQTLAEFELLVVDDGSEDETPAMLAAVADERVRVLRQERLGLVAALNRALGEARAPLLARMDADDVSLPERLERQVDYLEARPRVALVVTGVETIGRTATVVLPDDDAALRRRLLLRNPFTHGAVALRAEAVWRAGGYRADYGANEDYDLWRRIARTWELGAIPDVLYRYREHPGAVTRSRVEERVRSRERLRDELWRDPALLRSIRGERDPSEARALMHEAVRRRRYGLVPGLAFDAFRASS
ncbi:MAG TPA: glycosyltransferase [Gaiellaceae bacterium]|nr:glycosyltransferase [Gaiellaceae bacterium]